MGVFFDTSGAYNNIYNGAIVNILEIARIEPAIIIWIKVSLSSKKFNAE